MKVELKFGFFLYLDAVILFCDGKIDDKIAMEKCKQQNRPTKEKVISYLTDPLHQAPKRLIRALIKKIIVFKDKIRIFFKYTKASPEGNPWEMPSYPCLDSSNMVENRKRKTNFL